MQIGTKAVVLSARNMEEHDRLVTLLTQDHGLVTAYAKGARRQKGTMASATEQLSYSAFQLFRSREKTYVDKAEAETIFFALPGQLLLPAMPGTDPGGGHPAGVLAPDDEHADAAGPGQAAPGAAEGGL